MPSTDSIDWTNSLSVQAWAKRLDAEDVARRERLSAPGALAAAASWYAAHGFAVFPLVPGGKAPATKHGLKDATTDRGRVKAWWAASPQSNIGLPTGLRFDVLDVDPPFGWASLADLREGGMIPDTQLGRVSTPRGLHLYFEPVEGRGNRAGFMPGLDYRGAGGYVVAPPSRCEIGMWQWIPGLHLGQES